MTSEHPLEAPIVWIFASFADGPGGGNPAGVVLSAEPLPTEAAQGIARILSVPTTGFVAEPEKDASTIDARFFTPEKEIEACVMSPSPSPRRCSNAEPGTEAAK